MSGCVVAIAGLYEEPTSDFHLGQIVRAACAQSGSLRERADAFLKMSRKPYRAAVLKLREEKKSNPYGRLADEEVQTVFAGIQDGHLALMVRGLRMDEAGKMISESLETSAPDYVRIGFFLGLNRRIRSYVGNYPDWEADSDLATLASRFVKMEIEAHPGLAGLPISELELDHDGNVRWIAKGACDRNKIEAD